MFGVGKLRERLMAHERECDKRYASFEAQSKQHHEDNKAALLAQELRTEKQHSENKGRFASQDAALGKILWTAIGTLVAAMGGLIAFLLSHIQLTAGHIL